MKFYHYRSRLVALLLLLALFCTNGKAWAQSNNPTQQYFEISKSIEIITQVFRQLNRSYVNPIQPGKMTKAGINAMLKGLDPYTNFFTEADAENFKMHAAGQYGGIGIQTAEMDSSLVVKRVFKGSPADKAGIHIGDIILAANGRSVKGKSSEELEVLMQGDKGTPLSLKIQNPITKHITSKTVKRSQIHISDVPYAGLLGKNNDIAYVKLTQFMGPASENILRALDSLKKVQPHLKGVVLDLRNNPGGLLKEAVRTVNIFVPEGQTVVTTKGKNDQWQKVFRTTAPPWDTAIHLAVLVNHHSASSSEIVAGTIQDLDRGVIIGTRSFGKGLVQQVRPLGYNTSLKLTVAHYYTPSGRCIQALDYAHRNPDGSVSKIPDSLQHTFKTRNGRLVKDGGGIKPDIFIPEENPDAIIKVLINQNEIFNYATKYYYSHPKIAAPRDFHLSANDFSDFKNWLKKQNFISKTKEGQLLDKLKTEAMSEHQFEKIETSYKALKNQLFTSLLQTLDKNKTAILNRLSVAISRRYYYQQGATLNRLSQDDPTLDKAIQILYNNKSYRKILL